MTKKTNKNTKPIKSKSPKLNIKQAEKPVSNWVYFLLISLAIILTYIAFVPSLKNGFVSWDDEGYLFENGYIINYGWKSTKAIFSNIIMANYHPLTIYVYATLHHLYKFIPYPYHLFNVVFHLFNVFLVFFFIYKISNKNITISFVTALLFGIHPLHVESVTWVSETKDVLYTFFFLIGLICYFKYAITKQNKIFFYSLSLLFFILSCLSKGMAVVFPLILVIIDYINDKRLHLKTQLNKIPFFIIALIFGIIAIKAQATDKGIFDTSSFTLFDKIVLPTYGMLFYIVKMIYPANLSIIYPYPDKTSSMLPFEYLVSPVILIILIGLVIYSLKYNRKIAFGSLFFFFCILPVLQIIPVGISIASDRYFYLSSIGLFFLVGFGLNYFIENAGKIKPMLKYIVVVFIIFISIVLVNLTRQRTKVWKNTITLWTDVIRYDPKIDKPYYNLGLQLDRNGNIDSAIVYYKKAINCNPKNVKALNNLGNRMYDKQLYDSALFYYNKLVIVDTLYYPVYHNLGNIYSLKGNLDKAIEYYNKTLTLKNDFALSYYTLGTCWNRKGDSIKSKENFMKAAQLGNTDAQNYLKYKNIKW
jgi:hypothetical protein